jgi:hypothetical protein
MVGDRTNTGVIIRGYLMPEQLRHQFYQSVLNAIPAIEAEARNFAKDMGWDKFAGKYGTYQGSSSTPGRLPDYVLNAIVEANKQEILPARRFADQIRELVKHVYGDDFDVCVTNTAEASLRVTYETLLAPPTMRKGDQYRARVLQLLGEDFEWGGGYGRAFPPRYKNLAIDRTVVGGELGIEGKCLANLDTLFVKGSGVKYEVHGCKPALVPLMTEINVADSLDNMHKAADRHGAFLTGVHAVGYDTPGWGFGEQDSEGTPVLMKGMASLAQDYDVPFILDCASCLPFVGLDPRKVGADIMIYSMDKAGRAPIAGLIIGKSDSMSAVRKSMGWDGPRGGGVSSYSKGVFSMHDPGRDSLVGLHAFLKTMVDTPKKVTDPVDGMYKILMEELRNFAPKRFRNQLMITKSYHMGGLELNYARTWQNGSIGLPLHNLEDLYANTNAVDSAMVAMGQAPSTIYGGNVLIGPGLGLIDQSGDLIPDVTRAAFQGLIKSFEIVAKHVGLGD